MIKATITDYLIVDAENEQHLQELVNDNIKDWGWQPLGGIAVLENEYYQAMVKYRYD